MNKQTLVFQGPCFSRSGYGDHSRDLLRSLRKLDTYDIRIIPTRWGTTPQNYTDTRTEFSDWLVSKITTKLTVQPDVFIQVTVPNEFNPIGRYNIGITAGVETTLIPREFIEGANKMDLILVPSNFTKNTMESIVYQEKNKNTDQVIREHRITKPIQVLHEGVDTSIFRQMDSPDVDILDEVQTPFNFLIVGHWLKGDIGHDRKDIGMTIKTIASVFKSLPEDKRPGLIIKTSQAGFSILDRDEMMDRIKSVLSPIGDTLPVYLLHGDLNESEMNLLYQHPKVKVLVSFTKGEGYGRPLAEFCTTGKPVLVSNWSGHLDFLPPEGATLLDGELQNVHPSAADKFLLKEAKWFYINYSEAARKIYNVYQNYEAEAKRSSVLIKNIQSKFSLDKMTSDFEKILEKSIPKIVPINLPKLELPKLEKLS